jgi:outer membrane protein assembly factor BamC
MNRSLPLFFVSLLLIGVLAGCGGNILPESKKIEYKSAGKAAAARDSSRPDPAEPRRALRGPDVSSSKGSATYSAYSSERSGQARTTTAQDLLPQVDKMRIERSGTQRWLVVGGRPTSFGLASRSSGRNSASW